MLSQVAGAARRRGRAWRHRAGLGGGPGSGAAGAAGVAARTARPQPAAPGRGRPPRALSPARKLKSNLLSSEANCLRSAAVSGSTPRTATARAETGSRAPRADRRTHGRGTPDSAIVPAWPGESLRTAEAARSRVPRSHQPRRTGTTSEGPTRVYVLDSRLHRSACARATGAVKSGRPASSVRGPPLVTLVSPPPCPLAPSRLSRSATGCCSQAWCTARTYCSGEQSKGEARVRETAACVACRALEARARHRLIRAARLHLEVGAVALLALAALELVCRRLGGAAAGRGAYQRAVAVAAGCAVGCVWVGGARRRGRGSRRVPGAGAGHSQSSRACGHPSDARCCSRAPRAGAGAVQRSVTRSVGRGLSAGPAGGRERGCQPLLLSLSGSQPPLCAPRPPAPARTPTSRAPESSGSPGAATRCPGPRR